jgi:hypothetical protein
VEFVSQNDKLEELLDAFRKAAVADSTEDADIAVIPKPN